METAAGSGFVDFGYRLPVIIGGEGLVREGEEATPSRSVLGTSPEEVGGARKIRVGSVGNRGYLRSVHVTFGEKKGSGYSWEYPRRFRVYNPSEEMLQRTRTICEDCLPI